VSTDLRKTEPRRRASRGPGPEPPLPPTGKPRAGVLERALSILDCFSEERLKLHLREIATLTGLDKATLLRLLATLAQHNYVHRFEDGRYAPGPAHLRLGALYRATTDLGSRLMPVIETVSDRIGETVAFYIRSGDDRLCLYRDNVPRRIRQVVEVGATAPLAQGGGAAHVLLAYTGGEGPRVHEVLASGYCMTRGERAPELTSTVVPVFESDGAFLGALSAGGFVERQSEAQQLAIKDIMIRELLSKGFLVRPPKA
jgi:DNA-binding IclR family transcriptional regulator